MAVLQQSVLDLRSYVPGYTSIYQCACDGIQSALANSVYQQCSTVSNGPLTSYLSCACNSASTSVQNNIISYLTTNGSCTASASVWYDNASSEFSKICSYNANNQLKNIASATSTTSSASMTTSASPSALASSGPISTSPSHASSAAIQGPTSGSSSAISQTPSPGPGSGSGSSSGLSIGAIVGIVIGAIALLIVGFLIYYCGFKKRRSGSQSKSAFMSFKQQSPMSSVEYTNSYVQDQTDDARTEAALGASFFNRNNSRREI